jgi:hypothetical protein
MSITRTRGSPAALVVSARICFASLPGTSATPTRAAAMPIPLARRQSARTPWLRRPPTR